MKILKPTRTLRAFQALYDNGGFFWNLFSRRADKVISAGEVAKAAAAVAEAGYAVLQFEVLRDGLPPGDAAQALAMLDARMKARHRKHAPLRLDVERLAAGSGSGKNVIVTGVATPHPDPASVPHTVTTFMMVGKAVVPVSVLLHQRATLYQLRAGTSARGPAVLLAVHPKKSVIPRRPQRFGGIAMPGPDPWLSAQFCVDV